jgi:hypothetical protein
MSLLVEREKKFREFNQRQRTLWCTCCRSFMNRWEVCVRSSTSNPRQVQWSGVIVIYFHCRSLVCVWIGRKWKDYGEKYILRNFTAYSVQLILQRGIKLKMMIYTQNVQQDATLVSWFYYKIALHVSGTFRTHHQEYNNCIWQPLVQYMLRRIVNLVVTSVLKTVQDRAVGHITVVELEQYSSNNDSQPLICVTVW